MVETFALRSVAFSILLLLGACAGDPSLPETTAAQTAVTPVPQAKPEAEAPVAVADLVDEVKAPQELSPAEPAEAALPDGRAAAARIAKRPAGTEVGYLLLDIETGQVLAELDADLPLIPASTTKLATAVVALDVLGAEHRYRTELLGDGAIEQGVLKGDLILRGTGNPALDLADLLELAVQLGNLGVFRVEGRFLIDDTAFPVLSEIDPHSQPRPPTIPGSARFRSPSTACVSWPLAARRRSPCRRSRRPASSQRRRRCCRTVASASISLATKRWSGRSPIAAVAGWRRCRSKTPVCTPVACFASSRAARASCSMPRSVARRRARLAS